MRIQPQVRKVNIMPCRSLRFGLLQFTTLLAILLASATARSTPIQSNLSEILDDVDSSSFVMSFTAAASEAATAQSIALRNPKIQYLVSNDKISISEMSRRFTRAHGLRYETTKIVYFIVFGRTKNTQAALLIADYLDSLPDTDEKRAEDFDTNPFQYAAIAAADMLDSESLQAFAKKYENRLRAGSISQFSLRHELATLLRAAYRQRLQLPAR